MTITPAKSQSNCAIVINTRPAPMGLELEALLKQNEISSLFQPALQNQPVNNALANLDLISLSQATLIFISRSAVNAFYQQIKNQPDLIATIKQHPRIFAVGQSSAKQLTEQFKLNPNQVEYPAQSDSEGLLAMDFFHAVDKHPKVFIFKGVNGRELLNEQLRSRGFEVSEWSLYKRLEIEYPDASQRWKTAQIILVTSRDIAHSVTNSLKTDDSTDLNHWSWLVFSDRIKSELLALGIEKSRIHICEQMDNSSIIKHIKQLAK